MIQTMELHAVRQSFLHSGLTVMNVRFSWIVAACAMLCARTMRGFKVTEQLANELGGGKLSRNFLVRLFSLVKVLKNAAVSACDMSGEKYVRDLFRNKSSFHPLARHCRPTMVALSSKSP